MTTRLSWSAAQTLTATLILAVTVPSGAAAASPRRGSGRTLAAHGGTAGAASQARPSVRLPGHVLPALARATRLATPVGADMSARTGDPAPPLTLTLVLKRDDQAGFERYLHDLHAPGSPSDNRFLTARDRRSLRAVAPVVRAAARVRARAGAQARRGLGEPPDADGTGHARRRRARARGPHRRLSHRRPRSTPTTPIPPCRGSWRRTS